MKKKQVLEQLKKIILTEYSANFKNSKKEVAKLFNFHKDILQPTTFEIMDKQTKENCHSNLISYCLRDTKIGYVLLNNISNSLKLNINKIHNTTDYDVYTEYPTDENYRIDIFIKSKNNDWSIVIENKFNDKLHDIENGVTQTSSYKDFIYRKFKNIKNKYFIILDYKYTEFDVEYKTINYHNLLNYFLKIKKSDYKHDRIISEYIILLKRLNLDLMNKNFIKINEIKSLSYLNYIKKELSYV